MFALLSYRQDTRLSTKPSRSNKMSAAIFLEEDFTSTEHCNCRHRIFDDNWPCLMKLSSDLRDPSTTPLNFTKSINLALSERGINSMRHSQCEGLVEEVLKETIPMHARMIHGRRKGGELYHESQEYDANGRVYRPQYKSARRGHLTIASTSKQRIVRVSTNASSTPWKSCPTSRCTSITS